MDKIICAVEENKLIRLITVRQFCENEMLKDYAISIALSIIEKIEKIDGLKLYEGQYVENFDRSFSYLPIEVSYAVLYQTESSKERLLDLIKNINKL